MVPFTPVVEPDLPGALITEHPRDVITENSLNIPLLTGITFDEGLMKTAGKKMFSFFCLLSIRLNKLFILSPIII